MRAAQSSTFSQPAHHLPRKLLSQRIRTPDRVRRPRSGSRNSCPISPRRSKSNSRQFCSTTGAYELSINTEAFRAQGVETTVESGIGRNLFLRGGYTYLDAVVQRSFTNDDVALLGGPIRPRLQRHSDRRVLAARGRSPLPPRAAHRLFHGHLCRQAFHRHVHFRLRQPQRRLHLLEGEDVNGRQKPAAAQPQSRLRLCEARSRRQLPAARAGSTSIAQAENLLNNSTSRPSAIQACPSTSRVGLRTSLGAGQRSLIHGRTASFVLGALLGILGHQLDPSRRSVPQKGLLRLGAYLPCFPRFADRSRLAAILVLFSAFFLWTIMIGWPTISFP